jgi:Spy/CpxP family protein refolding chaperone
MKKILLILMFVCTAAGITLAQEGGETPGGGKLQAYQIAFLTKKLNLTPEEAQRFWPVFNKYQDEIRISRIQSKQSTEVEKEEKEVNIRKKYFDEFSKVLNREKADRVFKADKEFRDVVRKELMERRQLRQQGKRPIRQ